MVGQKAKADRHKPSFRVALSLLKELASLTLLSGILSFPNPPGGRSGSDWIESVGECWNGMYMEAPEGMVMAMSSKSMGDLYRR